MDETTNHGGVSTKPLVRDGHVLHSIIDGSFVPTFVIDRDHRVLYWNRALEEISKIPASSVIGTNEHWRAFYKKQRPCMADLLVDGAMQEIPRWYAGKHRESTLIGEAFEATDFYPELGESGRWLRFTASTIRDEQGEIVGAVETLEDISEQKLAEDALRESQQRLYQILEGSPIAAFVIDRDHQVIFWNRALEELSRIRADDVVGTDQHWRAFYGSKRPCMADLIIDEKLADVKKWYAAKGHPSNLLKEAFEATDFFPDLGEGGRWLRFTAAAIRNSQGALVGAVETLEDITERKTSEQALMESEQRLHSILQGSTIPTFVIGKDHRVRSWNKALEELSRIHAKEVLETKQHWRAFDSEERPCMAELLVDGDVKEVPRWYQGKYSKSKLLKDAFEAVDFFPSLGDGNGCGSPRQSYGMRREKSLAHWRPWRISRSASAARSLSRTHTTN